MNCYYCDEPVKYSMIKLKAEPEIVLHVECFFQWGSELEAKERLAKDHGTKAKRPDA